MKSLKTAVVVAGTVIVAGAGAPAYALGGEDVSRVDLNGVTDTLDQRPGDDTPLQRQAERLGLTKKSPVGKTLQSSTGLTNSGSLLGGLPLGR